MYKLSGMLPFLVLAALGSASLVAAIGAWQRRAAELGEGRFELLRDQHDRLELLREELERGRLARSGDQRNVQRLERDIRELR